MGILCAPAHGLDATVGAANNRYLMAIAGITLESPRAAYLAVLSS